jgi:hypothetical protein
MSEYIQELWQFVWAVVTNWAGLTTGGVIVALLWLWSTLKQTSIPRKAGIVVALLFLFLAVFNAWREQYKKVQTAAADVPELKGWIDGLLSGEMPMEGRGAVSMILLTVAIKSLRSPSIVQGYECTARTPNGESYKGQPQTVPADMKLQGKWGVKELSNMVPLYEKTAETPIERGGMRRGLLLFTFPDANSRFGLGSTFDLTFEDVVGKKSSATVTVKSEDGGSPLYYPGTQKPSK